MLNRNVIRTILDSTETTKSTNTINSDALAFVIGVANSFYIGYQYKFAARYIHMGTANTNTVTTTVEYWNGTAYAAVDDVMDQTNGFKNSGFISWINKADWQAHNQAGTDADLELYWVKVTVSGTLSAGTTVQAVLNLFCDDGLLRAYYPELITDTRYLPSSRTDFVEQYQAAKDLCVLRMKQRRLIDNEGQVIDINDVSIAATHAAAWIILSPIAGNDAIKALSEAALDKFNNEIGSLTLGVDSNKDGIVSEGERSFISVPFIMRR
jgi:hypothetical protein